MVGSHNVLTGWDGGTMGGQSKFPDLATIIHRMRSGVEDADIKIGASTDARLAKGMRKPKQGHCVEDAARELHLDTLAFHRTKFHASTDDCLVPVDGVLHHAALAVA